jgi:hypothetical protein
VQAVAGAVVAAREQYPERFAPFFSTLIDGLRTVALPPNDATARSVLVTLACAAASVDDLERFLDIADPTLPWESAWRDGSARWVKGRSVVARVFDALAARGATYADAIDGVQALGAVSAKVTGRSRGRVAALALALVRRTLRERAMLEPPDRLGALVGGLMHIWASDVVSSADEADRALRRFLGTGESLGPSHDPRRLAAELSRAIGEAADGGETELLGWATAGIERANAGAVGDMTVRVVAALIEEHRRPTPRSELAVHVGRVLLHFAGTDAAFVFRPAWLDLARQVDDASRRELLARALGWVARGFANGKFTVGAFADACVAAGGEGVAIDDATVELLVPHLVVAATARANSTELGLLVATLASVATPVAAERLTSALLGAADETIADAIRMRRLALALQEIERVRDEDRYGEARAALRRVLARGAMTPDEERALRVFLGVEDGTVMSRLLGRLPSLTPRPIAATGDRR